MNDYICLSWNRNKIQTTIKGVKATFDDHILSVEYTEFDVTLISRIVSEMRFIAILLE